MDGLIKRHMLKREEWDASTIHEIGPGDDGHIKLAQPAWPSPSRFLCLMGNCFGKQADTVRPVYSTPTNTTACSTSGVSTNTATTSQSYSSDFSISNIESGTELARFSTSGGTKLRKFSYAELRLATRNFKQGGQIGEGGFGTVYKGYVDEKTFSPTKPGQGIIVAVKKLNLESWQGHKEWLTEVKVLGSLHHPNLVKLIGYCAEDANRLLVYEYMPRGSLENHLFSKWRNGQKLTWEIRIKVALGAARGLAFLHDAQTKVIYRDFKAANILLDDEFNGKLSDFGLARDGPEGDATHVSTAVLGTYGYAAPEYLATGHLSARSDVYSFGVVLLELLTGRAAMDPHRPSREQKLVEWAKPYLNDKKRVLRIMDQKLEGQYSLKGAHKVANLALWCLSGDSKARPKMIQVVETLETVMHPREKRGAVVSPN